MKRLRFAALSLGLFALTACTHGLELENGQRPVQPISRISFLFAEGQSDILMDQPQATAQLEQSPAAAPTSVPPTAPTGGPTAAPTSSTTSAPTESAQPSPDPPAAPSEPSPTATGASGESTPTAAPIELTEAEVAAIAANDAAKSLAIPAAEVDPGLETIDETADPTDFLSPQLIAESNLISFYITGSSRQPTASTVVGRPIRLVQRLFVHADEQGASRMFQELVDNAAPGFAIAALNFFRDVYPDLEPESRGWDLIALADQNQLFEVRIDPNVEPSERELGPGDPHIFFLILRQGRVTALFEVVYLSAEDQASVTVLGERLINRIPPELAEASAS